MKDILHSLRHLLTLELISVLAVTQTIFFPLEHILWDKIWPWNIFGHWLEGAADLPKGAGIVILVIYTYMVVKTTKYVLRKDASLHEHS